MILSIPAMAATQSKTTEDLTRITTVQPELGTMKNAIVWVEEEESETAVEQIEAITTYLKQDAVVTNYFTPEVKLAMAALLPVETDLSKLKLNELISIGIGEYQPTYGDIIATFQFPTQFELTQTVSVLIGYPDQTGVLIWQPLLTVIEEGNLKMVFPNELMADIGPQAILAVLSD